MSDTRAVMREFRLLDEKRKLGSLSPTEETRWHELRAQLGAPEAPQAPAAVNPYAAYPQGYWGQDGQWYAYPAAYPPGAYAPAQDAHAAAYAAAYAQQQQAYAAAYGGAQDPYA